MGAPQPVHLLELDERVEELECMVEKVEEWLMMMMMMMHDRMMMKVKYLHAVAILVAEPHISSSTRKP
jgi:hypothetical protein